MKKSKLNDKEREMEAVAALDLVRHGEQESEPEVLKTEMGLTWKSALPGLGLMGAGSSQTSESDSLEKNNSPSKKDKKNKT